MGSYPALFYFLEKKRSFCFLLLISLLAGLAYPYQPYYFSLLSPFGHIFGFLLIFISASYIAPSPTSISKYLLVGLSIKTMAQISWLLSHPYLYIFIVWPIISFLLALPLAYLFSIWIQKVRISPILSSCIVSALAALYESALVYSFPPISFYTSATILTWSVYGIQFASIIGREGLSFLIFLSSCFGLLTWKSFQEKKLNKTYIALWLLVSSFPYVFGLFRLHSIQQEAHPSTSIKIALCHMEEKPDVFELGQITPWDFATQEWIKVLTMLKPLYKKHVAQNLIVIPEGAIPYPDKAFLVKYDALLKKMPKLRYFFSEDAFQYYPTRYTTSLDTSYALSCLLKTPILIGLESKGASHTYNSAYLISSNKRGLFPRYDKQLLIPFGEYIPFSLVASILQHYGVHGSFAPGETSQIFSLFIPTLKRAILFSPLICYEETFPAYGFQCRKKGAECIVSLSNDGWFPAHALKWLHFDLARIQAVELGIPFIRATNMGITGAIDSYGRIISSYEGTELHDNQLIQTDVAIPEIPLSTPYFRFWNWLSDKRKF